MRPSRPFLCVVLLLVSEMTELAAALHGTWATVGQQKTVPDPFARNLDQLPVRYSHSAVVWKDSMVRYAQTPSSFFVPILHWSRSSLRFLSQIVTHGYFYNRNAKPSQPAWLHDTWSFSFTTRKWVRRVCVHMTSPGSRYGLVLCV